MTDDNVHYQRSLEFLYQLRWFGAKFGLENTRRLASLAGNPERQLRFIHVAGTNGKGSTCAMLESICRTAGFRTGLFTSPHLVSFRERMQVNRSWISKSDVVRLVERLKPLIASFPADSHPTFFEALTVMALIYFAEQGCEVVIWETGLGGRLDATNIVTPLASVITNIEFDHEKWLGNTLAEIASEKAGIIKPGIPVITGETKPEPLRVIRDTAEQRGAALHAVESAGAVLESIAARALSLAGAHQRQNAALAVAVAQALHGTMPLPDSAIRTGLATVHWPGRMQRVKSPQGCDVILDGAHNIAGAQALAAALESEGFAPSTLILGVLQDKDYAGICRVLAPLAPRILLTAVQTERSAQPQQLAAVCAEANPSAEIACCESLQQAMLNAASGSRVVITGSLYLIGEAMLLLGLAPDDAGDERTLNEWLTKR